MADKTEYQPGQIVLNDTAVILEHQNDAVLAVIPEKTPEPFVVWSVGPDGRLYSGHYEDKMSDAIGNFARRAHPTGWGS